ncbi:MAG: hypothetical protein HQL25_00100 [Candidatus Omnitrophica bacterium]|nr:hypothetical protein [Candidatus Omnitrophota bacterium]
MIKKMGISGRWTMASTLAVLVIMGIALLVDWLTPLKVRYVHDKIKIGMTGEEVQRVLNGQGRYFLHCEGELKERNFFIATDKCFETVSSLPSQKLIKSVRMNVLFMGPAYWHNEFDITFAENGKVKEISSVRGWDW